MLAIAIISLTFCILGIVYDLIESPAPKGRVGLWSITVISWWHINVPLAIILLVLGSFWFIISAIAAYNK